MRELLDLLFDKISEFQAIFSGETIFSQVIEQIHPQQFRRCVARYRGN
jgi:hypothetical protein